MADDKIGRIGEERENLQKLEAPLREATMKDPGAALQARQALQAEVDKINNSKALSDPSVRQEYIHRLAGLLEADDYSGIAPPDNKARANRVHLPTVKEDKPGHLIIVPDATIKADEDRVKANAKLDRRTYSYWDASQATHFAHTHGKPEEAITDYEKKVFGLPLTASAASANQYESEFDNLRLAAFNLYAARQGLTGTNLEKAKSKMSALLTELNNEGPDHVNHLARGMNHIYTQCLENRNGKLVLKSEADLAVWQKAASGGDNKYDLR
jgi:hypothetical protein